MFGQCPLTRWFVRTRPASSFQAKAGVKVKGRRQRRQTSTPRSLDQRNDIHLAHLLYSIQRIFHGLCLLFFEQSSRSRLFEKPVINSFKTFAPESFFACRNPSLASIFCIQLTASHAAGIRIADDTVCELSRIPITSHCRVTINNIVRPNLSGTFHTSLRIFDLLKELAPESVYKKQTSLQPCSIVLFWQEFDC